MNSTTAGFHRGNTLWCGLDFAQQAFDPLRGHKVQSPSSRPRGAQGRVSAAGQQPPQSSRVESKSKVWLSPLCWHAACEEGEEARARPTRSLKHISLHPSHQSQNKLALPLTPELLRHTTAALRPPLRHPACVVPGALPAAPPGTAEPPTLFALSQGRREAMLIKGARSILRAGICGSRFTQKALRCLRQLWDCASSKLFLFFFPLQQISF